MSALDAKPSAPDKNNALVRRLSTPIAVTVLLGLTLAFYHGLWLPDLVLIKRDAFRFFLPLKQYLIERLATGELPQWFPYEGLGRSFIGVTHTGVFHPFTALYFLFPVHDAYRASTLLSCLLAAGGAFVLGRKLGFSHTAALAAGVAFALSGYVVSLTDNLVYLYSICVLPLFCAALEKALVSSRTWAVVPAVIWATVFLTGDVQTGYYYVLIALLWTAARAPGPYREAGLRLALTGGLSALIAGIQLGPSWAAFANSDRLDPASFLGQALYWSVHPLRLLTVLTYPVGADADPADLGKFFFGSPTNGLWSESLFLGIPVAGLACLGAWYRRDLKVLALLGGLALLLSLGQYGGLYQILYRALPLWSAFRYPEKLMGVVSFAAAMLAGAGLDVLRAGRGHPAPWLGAAGLCLGLWFGLRTEAAVAWTAVHFGAPMTLAAQVTGSAGTAFLFSGAAALGVSLVAAGRERSVLRIEWLLAVLVAIITLDLARANSGAYHTGPVETATFSPPLAQAIADREGELAPGRYRLITVRDGKFFAPERMFRLLGHDANSVEGRQALALEHNAQFHIETVYYYLSGLKEKLPPSIGTDAAARFNVTYYIGRHTHLDDPRYAKEVVARLPEYDRVLFKNPVPAKPRAYLSRRPERVVSPVDPKALFTRPDFLNGEVDVIETAGTTLTGSIVGGSATIEHYAPEEVRVRVETPQSAVLILLDAFDKGWTATLETGAELPILRANALVRAVVVPTGTHTITFRYVTPLLRIGALASLAGCLIGLGLIVRERWWRHPDRGLP